MKHVLVIPLNASTSDIQRVDFLMKSSGQLRNAVLGTMIGRAEQLRRDPRWSELRDEKKSKSRTDTYNKLKKEYCLNEFDTIRAAQKHALKSGWLKDHLDGRIITSLGKEVWTPINLWLHNQAGKPRFVSANKRAILSGNDQRAGLRYKNGYVVHSTQAINRALKSRQPLGEKLLKIRVGWENIPKKRRKYYHEQTENIKKVSIVRRGINLEAHLVYDCLPYRHENKICQARENLKKQVSFDLGPSSLAFVAPSNNQSGVIQPTAKMRSEIKKERSKRHRLERAIDRSKRVNNPDCFQKNGSYIPGKKIKVKSKNYFELQQQLRDSYGRERRLVDTWHQKNTHQLTDLGLEFITEKDTISNWQEGGYGRSITTLAPAALKDRLFYEAKVLREHHGLEENNTELNTYSTWLSQSCLCGQRVKKELHERVHNCQNQDCLLYNIPLHRDKFSALLGYWIKQLGTSTNSHGIKSYNEKQGVKRLINQTYHTQERRTVAIELCSIGSLDHNPENTPDSMSSAKLLEKVSSKVELGQVKTSSRQVKASKRIIARSSLSKPSRSLTQDREGRVNHLNATDIQNTKKLEKSSGI